MLVISDAETALILACPLPPSITTLMLVLFSIHLFKTNTLMTVLIIMYEHDLSMALLVGPSDVMLAKIRARVLQACPSPNRPVKWALSQPNFPAFEALDFSKRIIRTQHP